MKKTKRSLAARQLIRLSPAALRAVWYALQAYIPDEHYDGWMEAAREVRLKETECQKIGRTGSRRR